MRVVIMGINYAPEPTGIARYTTGMAEGLVEAGHDVRVVTGYPHYPAWRLTPGYRGLRTRETIDGVDLLRIRHTVPAHPSSRGRMVLEASFAAHSLLPRLGDPDVVLTVSPSLLGAAAAVLRSRSRRRRPAVGVIVQDIYSSAVVETDAMGGRGAGAVAALESRVLRSADGVCVIHDRFRELLVGALGVDAGRVTVIRNWTRLAAPATGADLGDRERFGWSDRETVVLHAGNMGAKQDLDNVVEAARLADAQQAPVRFVLLGDGNQRAALQQRAAGVRRLQFLDTLPDPQFEAALRNADVLLVNERAGLAEMCVPSKLTTYFAMGKPVLAATEPHGATAFEIDASGAGVRVPPGRPAELVSAALAMTGTPERAASLAASGERYAATVLSRRTAVAAYDGWVRELAARRPRVRAQ